MSIRFRCACGKKLTVPDGSEGKRAQCPVCWSIMHVPEAAEPGAKEEKRKDRIAGIEAKAAPLPAAFMGEDEPAEEEDAPQPEPETEAEPEASSTRRSARIAAIAAAAKEKREEKKRILLVDDEPDTLETVRDMLELHNYEVICAVDGEEAIEKAQTVKPHLIVLDVMLPKLSGFEVCKQIKDPMNPKNRDCWRTPVIMLTARSKGRDVQYAKSVGADGYVRKPFKPTDLHKRIEKLLLRRRLP